MFKKFPWHTLFFAAYPVLFLYAHNVEIVKSKEIIKPLTLVLLGTAVVAFVFFLFFKNRIKAGILASITALLLLSYGLYHEKLHTLSIPFFTGSIRFDYNFYKWASLGIFCVVVWRLYKTKSDLKNINGLLNIVSLVLISFSFFEIIQYHSKKHSIQTIQNVPQIIEKENVKTLRPTIYYFVMDAYTRNDVLKEYFNFDNSAFTDYLKQKGFYLADKSISNYGQTFLSLPSSLNMSYLDSIANAFGEDFEDRWAINDYLQNNKVLCTLKSQGYKSVAFDAAMFDVVFLTSVDKFINTPGTEFSMFSVELLNNSILTAFKDKKQKAKTIGNPEDFHRKKILNAFEKIEMLSKSDKPHFVHAHVLAPHQPFLFDENGNAQEIDYSYRIWKPLKPDSDNAEYKKGYIGQLKFVNKKLMKAIDEILANKSRPSIIIIQGDHGSCSELRNYLGFENNDFKERFSILNAYYFPDQDYSMLYDSISPVNSFKVVLNKYFDGNYELDEDRAFFSNWDKPYKMYDVTDSIK
ncbi:MAG: hypothetical protein H6607_10285 [Flavobacteriales bacterium]|nr:hypothetical protein [Flavobacteriales bacterium]